MQPLTNAIPLSASFPIQQATHDPPVVRLFRREPPSSSKVSLLDSPNAPERYDRRDRVLLGSHDSVQRIFVCVESDRPRRLVCLRHLLPNDKDNPAGTTVREPKVQEESLRNERCHPDRGRWTCTPSVPWIGIRRRPVSRSSRYDWFSAFSMSLRTYGTEERFFRTSRRRCALRTAKATSKADGMYCLYTACRALRSL